MNILYTNFHDSNGGGHDTYIKTLCDSNEHNIYVACPETSLLYQSLKQSNYSNLFALDFPGKGKDLFKIIRSIRSLIEIIKKHKIDIVHTNGSSDNRIAIYAKFLFRTDFKIVFTKHNSFPSKGFISQWRLMKLNDAIIFVSQSIYRTIGFPVKSNKVFVVRNCIDTSIWVPQPKINNNFKIRLISNAGTGDYKGWHYLINALKLLPKEKRELFEVKIIGFLPEDTLKNKLCNNDALPEIVTFTGFVPDTKPLLADADIGFVLSDRIETISFACREMMSSGLPTIVSDFGGLSENITENVDGWIVPTANVNATTKLLDTISSIDRNKLEKMKQAARNKALKEFDISVMKAETNAVYNFVIESSVEKLAINPILNIQK